MSFPAASQVDNKHLQSNVEGFKYRLYDTSVPFVQRLEEARCSIEATDIAAKHLHSQAFEAMARYFWWYYNPKRLRHTGARLEECLRTAHLASDLAYEAETLSTQKVEILRVFVQDEWSQTVATLPSVRLFGF